MFLENNYLGSGKLIKLALKKYGRENFKKTILKIFETSKEMYETEKLIVNNQFLMQDHVYNLKLGGEGGFDFINKNGLGLRTGSKLSEESRLKISKAKRGISTITEEGRLALSKHNGMKQNEAKEKIKRALTDKPKTEEHKKKISESLKKRNRKNAKI